MSIKKSSILVAILSVGAIAGVFAATGEAEKKAAAPAAALAPVTGDVFYVYSERGSRLNHFKPSGWMGDFGDVQMKDGWKENVEKPKVKGAKKSAEDLSGEKDETCIMVKYSGEKKQGNGWAGIYWQQPANNWGDKRGGYNLTGFTKLVFMAKGEKGGELIDKFFMGGITGQTEEGDSDEASVAPVELTKDWKEYEIDLTGRDLSHIIGGFGFAVNSDSNPNGLTMFIDSVRYVKGGKAAKK